ncbi:MAG: phage tail tape measure protein, partial [Treponema sp.]|nr:phage tail tape measure protein [Treponema sp.]
MAVTAREVIFRILGDTDEFVEGYTEANRALDDFEKKTKKTGKLLSDIAKKSAAVTAAVMAAGAALGKIAADFNAALAPIETLIPGQTARVNELKSAIQDLSPAVRKTTDDLASGAYNIISAYGDAGDTVSKLEISAKTASAGMAGTNDAINLLSAVTKAYGDTSAAAQRQVADLAFVTLRNGQTSFPELAASIQRVTSLSSTLKISQKELFAVFAAGTGVIGGAAEVATKTAAAQAELLRGTDTLNAAFRELGVSSGTGLIEKFGGFQGALRALKDYADDTGVSITNLFGSVQAGQIALYLTGEGAEKFTRDLSDMQSAAGAMETAFDAATGGVNKFADGITQSKLNVTVFAQKLGDEVLASSRGFLDAVLSVTGALADMDRGTLETIVSVGKVVAVAAATTAALAGLSKGILAARAATIALTGAMAANPVGLAIVALTAGIVAFIEISKRLENSYQSQIDAGRRAAKQLDDERLAHQKNAQEYKNRSDNLGDLIKKYEDLSKEAADDARAQAELQAVVKRIGTIAPEAITEWNSYGDALSVNAEKAKEARDILAAIAKQELELS